VHQSRHRLVLQQNSSCRAAGILRHSGCGSREYDNQRSWRYFLGHLQCGRTRLRIRILLRRSFPRQKVSKSLDYLRVRCLPLSYCCLLWCLAVRGCGLGGVLASKQNEFTASGQAFACPSGLPAAHGSGERHDGDSEFCPQVNAPVLARVSSRRPPYLP